MRVVAIVLLFALIGFNSHRIDVKRTFKDQYQKFVRRESKRPSPSQPEIIVSPVIFLTSVPAGATVYVDGIRKGITPTGMSLTKGDHKIRFELEGYEDLIDTVTLKNGDNRTKAAILVPIKPGQVEAKKSPADRTLVRTHRPLSVILFLGGLFAFALAAVLFMMKKRMPSADPLKTQPQPPATQAIPPNPTQRQTYTEIPKNVQPLKPGTSSDFGAYTLQGILGRGGMGVTFLARRNRDGLPVAIKVPHEHLLDNQEFVQRFLREAALGSTLHHPNIIRIYESDKLNSLPYIVMELIDGETLEKKLTREGALPVAEALEITREIALALDYVRLKKVVHRDLKPDNVMMLKRGGLKVMDYGIARIMGSPGLTATEAYLGTPTYSAPEAMSGQVDQQSDLYSLGIILYRMLVGMPPFRSTTPLEVLQMHITTPLPAFPDTIPVGVQKLVKVLAAKQKAERYSDAESLLVELNRVIKTL